MKKIVSITLCLSLSLLVLFTLAASADISTDFSNYTYNELISLKEALDTEIMSRPENGKTKLSEGNYVVGSDISAGRYTLYFLADETDDTSTDYFVYENKSMYDYDVDRLWLGDLPKNEGTIKDGKFASIELINGDYFVLYNSGAEVERTGNAAEIADSDFVAPEGTTIPTGKYIVGDEIPEGKYNVYCNGKSTSRFRVYPDVDEASNMFGDPTVEVVLNVNNASTALNLKEGQVVTVEYSNIIMTKSEGFVFD
jgi:hypothetical protein